MKLVQVLVENEDNIDYYYFKCNKNKNRGYRLLELLTESEKNFSLDDILNNNSNLFKTLRYNDEYGQRFFMERVFPKNYSVTVPYKIASHISLYEERDFRHKDERNTAFVNYIDLGNSWYGIAPFEVEEKDKSRYLLPTVLGGLNKGTDIHNLLELTPNLYGLWLLEHNQSYKLSKVPADDSLFALFEIDDIITVPKERLVCNYEDLNKTISRAKVGNELIK